MEILENDRHMLGASYDYTNRINHFTTLSKTVIDMFYSKNPDIFGNVRFFRIMSFSQYFRNISQHSSNTAQYEQLWGGRPSCLPNFHPASQNSFKRKKLQRGKLFFYTHRFCAVRQNHTRSA